MARILTGVQSTGTPHLGNLLGAILPAIEQAKAKEELIILSLLVMAVVMMLVYIAIGSFRNVI